MRCLLVLVPACYLGGPPPAPAERPVTGHVAHADVFDGPIARHARIGALSTAWVDPGMEPIRHTQIGPVPHDVVPVLAATRDLVRIVITSDGARLALWIERSALAPTVIKD